MQRERPSLAVGIEAARRGDVAALEAWLAVGNDPNAFDEAGWSPLLWASVRGHHEAVGLLLGRGADPDLPHRVSGALPIYMAGHSGSVATTRVLLERRPDHLDAVMDMNGHTALPQAVFYGHLELARFLLERGADTSITTARGLGPMELCTQFQNKPMMDLVRPFDAPAERKAAYYQAYLERIAPRIPPGERPAQDLADRVVSAIENGIKELLTTPESLDACLARVAGLLEHGVDVNRLGGPLQQPPLIVAVTGNNGLPAVPAVAEFRLQTALLLLERGADPTLHEMHPMGAQTIIRGAVFNHLDILKACALKLSPQKLADAINEVPIVNGLTAMHDTVLRATMAAPERFEGYLDQARFFVQNGGRVDLEDFAGVTQRNLAERNAAPAVRQRLLGVLDGKI